MVFAFRPGARLFRRMTGRAGSDANAGALQNRKTDLERIANFQKRLRQSAGFVRTTAKTL
jgi:hypothetical protein